MATTVTVADATATHRANRTNHAQRALRRVFSYRGRQIATITSGALLMSVVAFPALIGSSPVEASSCGTNWGSRATPPQSIRVYLTNRHRVVVENFRSYVAMVMASGEWPSRLPTAVLEAGATAVKQYAWYYTLEGNHRPDYRTASGVCYDVRNDTSDQLFSPRAKPTVKQLRAVDDTWSLTLRKGDRFFLTGYRAGTSSRCGADADGWRLYARSAVDCARRGWSREKIQALYYAPRLSFVWNGQISSPGGKDTHAPDVDAPQVTPSHLQPGRGAVAVDVHWSATDDSGIASYQVEERVGAGAWHGVRLSSRHQTTVTVTTFPGTDYRFRVRAKDTSGNRSGWATGATFAPYVIQSNAAQLKGDWQAVADNHALGTNLSLTSVRGAQAHLTFQGSSIGVVASRAPGRGKFKVTVDGRETDIVHLDARREKSRKVVFSRTWSSSGSHTITIEALGTSSRPEVDVDAFLVTR